MVMVFIRIIQWGASSGLSFVPNSTLGSNRNNIGMTQPTLIVTNAENPSPMILDARGISGFSACVCVFWEVKRHV